MLDRWLGTARPGDEFIYHRGESIAADRLHDPDIDALADRMQQLADHQWEQITPCGHIRGLVVGSGQVQLLTRRDRGETVYFARRR